MKLEYKYNKNTNKNKNEIDENIYDKYINETIKKAPRGEKILRSTLYKLFVVWLQKNNYNYNRSSKVFAKELEKKINVEKSTVEGTSQFCINGYHLIASGKE